MNNPVSVLSFARCEWRRYARRMDPRYDAESVRFAPMESGEMERLHVADPFWDDAYRIDVSGGAGSVYYANERSALLGVYHLLREAGCAFLRPGPQGEVVPVRSLDSLGASLTVRAANRHRGICIEGSVSLENVLDIIDYAPKAGYNAYFTQFRESYTFFERWYTHKDNPLRAGECFTPELAREMQSAAVSAVKRRGLLYHAVGHGWTCEALGIPGLHWEDDGVEPTPEQRRHMAEVNGVRGLYKGIALNTSLCYSNPATRTLMAREIAGYAEAHPEIDVLHVWLADDFNNQCECEACAARRPSDFYVDMLNEAAALLDARGLATRIVFLVYFDLLFPPQNTRLIDEGRFILMYAPITRSFSRSFRGIAVPSSIPEYVRNRLTFGADIADNLSYLAAWQEKFGGDSFDYDYHLFYGPNYDPGHLVLSRVLYDDIRALPDIGLNGMVNCQLQRVSMPHGFALFMAGQTLLCPALDYDKMLRTYFEQSFGPGWETALQFCETLSRLFPMDTFAERRPSPTPDDLNRLCELRKAAGQAQLRHVVCASAAQERSWRNLAFWQRLVTLLADYLLAFSNGLRAEWQAAWAALTDYAWTCEPDTQSEFDAYCFLRHYQRQQEQE